MFSFPQSTQHFARSLRATNSRMFFNKKKLGRLKARLGDICVIYVKLNPHRDCKLLKTT